MTQKQNILLHWQYEDKTHRSASWYIWAISIAVGLIIWGFLTSQYGLSVVVMLASWILFFLENNADEIVWVNITNLGIQVQWHFYDYGRIASFNLIYSWDQAVYLRLLMKKNALRTISIRIDNSLAQNIRSTLSQLLEESEKQDLTFSEKITHWLKI